MTRPRASRPDPGVPGTRAARPTRPRSLRWRIVAILAVLLTVTNVVVGVVTVVAFQGYLTGRLDSDLRAASSRSVGARDDLPSPPDDSSAPSVDDLGPPAGSGVDPQHDFIGAPGQAADTVVAVYRPGAPASFVLAGYTDAAGDQHRLGAPARRALAAVSRNGQPVTTTLGSLGEYRVIARTSGDSVFITGLPVGGITRAISRLVLVIAVVALLGVLIAAWAGAMLVRRALRPLSRVASTASAVTTMDLDRGEAPIDVRVADADLRASSEVGQVGTALNSLLGHVSSALAVRDRAETRVREFVADASHELRTPIATIRAYAELTARSEPLPDASTLRNVGRIGAEAGRMGDLVEELLLLARLDSAAPPVREPVDLSAMLVEAAMDARAAGPDHRWELVLGSSPVVVQGDPAQLRRVVVNLLANARVHTPAGTRVVASVASDLPGGAARLVVENDGTAIPASAIPTLFERFTRADASRTRQGDAGTTGLGLSIVRAVALAHDGSVTVTSDDALTRFTVTLPTS